VLVHVDVFGVSLNTFGIVFAVAFLACGLLIARKLRVSQPAVKPTGLKAPS